MGCVPEWARRFWAKINSRKVMKKRLLKVAHIVFISVPLKTVRVWYGVVDLKKWGWSGEGTVLSTADGVSTSRIHSSPPTKALRLWTHISIYSRCVSDIERAGRRIKAEREAVVSREGNRKILLYFRWKRVFASSFYIISLCSFAANYPLMRLPNVIKYVCEFDGQKSDISFSKFNWNHCTPNAMPVGGKRGGEDLIQLHYKPQKRHIYMQK